MNEEQIIDSVINILKKFIKENEGDTSIVDDLIDSLYDTDFISE